MKKVLALVLAIMMLATVAFAAAKGEGALKYTPSISPSSSVKVSQKDGVTPGLTHVTAVSTTDDTIVWKTTGYIDEDGKSAYKDSQMVTRAAGKIEDVKDMIFRSVTNENYSVSGLKVTVGRSLVSGVTINDKEERVEVKFVKDLNNTTAKSFDLSFTLKGKGKMILANQDEADMYNEFTGKTNTSGEKDPRERVTIPSVKFTMSGTVGYGKVEIFLGDDTDEDLEDIESNPGVDFEKDVVKFSNGENIGDYNRISRAGAFTADAILTQPYGEALTLEARVYSGDVLYFNCDNSPNRDVVGRLADSDADMDFYLFHDDKNFTTFNSNVKLYFNDAEEDDFVYQIKDNDTLVPVGEYNEDEGCWIVKTRTLGKYVVSDVELKEFEAAAGAADDNPDTGANDVVGIATALAAVALVSAAAVSLKK